MSEPLVRDVSPEWQRVDEHLEEQESNHLCATHRVAFEMDFQRVPHDPQVVSPEYQPPDQRQHKRGEDCQGRGCTW